MRKIITIAIREYKAMVGTKAFLISIIMMPILMLGGLFAMQFLNNVSEVKERKIAIADGTGKLLEAIQASAIQRNELIDKLFADEKANKDSDSGKGMGGVPSFSKGEKYEIEVVEGSIDDEQRVSLSQRVRNQDIYAFVEIPANALDVPDPNRDPEMDSSIKFYSQDSSLSSARGWLQNIIFETAKQQRLMAANIDPQVVRQASMPVQVRAMGLVAKSLDGSVSQAEEKDEMSAIFLPMGVMMMMFMVIFMASQPMLESVLEEKSQRIAEVLLGSANPFQLMCGKLLGTVAGSLTVFIIYLLGMAFVAQNRGWTDSVPFHLVPWFIVFQILGVLFYAAIFMAVGASVSQLKEAQSMLLPVWMLLMSPLFIWIFIVQDPNGTIAKWFSLFPPATPTTMMLRMSTGQTIPVWQPILGIVLTSLATIFIVIIAGRIFRVGILWQGKTPKISEIIRWGLTG
jgi:ABC-type Na+ efflux pump permease subunit